MRDMVTAMTGWEEIPNITGGKTLGSPRLQRWSSVGEIKSPIPTFEGYP